jgi:hypothetical protein
VGGGADSDRLTIHRSSPACNAFNGQVKGVPLAVAEDAEGVDHLVDPEHALRIAMAGQLKRAILSQG